MTISTPKFIDKYRIASNRMKGWDYGTPGYYFVTICTQKRVPWFGEIREGRMILSPAGMVVEEELEKTPLIRPNIDLQAWVIMPNHIHAIIVIDEKPGISLETSRVESKVPGIQIKAPMVNVEAPRRSVSTIRNWKPGSLGAIINQYKSICTKRIRAKCCEDFAWQARFYDHIIRNEKSLEKIRTYIIENTLKWTEDEYFSNL